MARIGEIAAEIRRVVTDRLAPRPLDGVEPLGAFVGQRAAYVAQTSLYGYLKTRMGTRFPEFFSDPAFSAAIQEAAVRVFASCASDLTVHAVALAGSGRLSDGEMAALARRVHGVALARGLADVAPDRRPSSAEEAFAERSGRTAWASAALGEVAFAGSTRDLIRHAPVVDEFKALDHAIVRNSMRFRWLDIREQLRRRLDAEAVCADWWRRTGA
jgi:hypothetical protein